MPLYEAKCKGIVYVALYVDDNLTVGNPEAKDEVVRLLIRKW